MEARAPQACAFFQNSPMTNTQQNAVSSPPKANMLIFQMTSGGAMAITSTMMPTAYVKIRERVETRASSIGLPLFSL